MHSVHQKRIREEYQLAAWTQQARRLGNPELRIRPEASAVLRNGEVEASVGIRNFLSVAVD
jgi:hypothetical protein